MVERIINLRAALDVALMLLNPRRRDDSTKELTSVIGTKRTCRDRTRMSVYRSKFSICSG
jgi:hypothetical protein